MRLIKCGTIETLDDPIFYAKVDGKLEKSGEIVKAYREYWLQANRIEPTEAEKQAANDEVEQDLADNADFNSQEPYYWHIF